VEVVGSVVEMCRWWEGNEVEDVVEESLSDSHSDSLSALECTESFWREREGEKRGSWVVVLEEEEEEGEGESLFVASRFSIGFGFERRLECVEPVEEERERVRFTTW
jgi:hypothetical protein